MKTGFHCALSFHRFSSSPSSIFLSLSALYYPASLCIFIFFLTDRHVYLESYTKGSTSTTISPCTPAGGRGDTRKPLTSCKPLVSLSLTSHSSTPLQYEVQLRPTPKKITFILLDSLIFQNIYITINSLICLTLFRAARKHALHFFKSSWSLVSFASSS